ncbi:MAG: ABC-type polysaccharide/polyol phosphate export permease [Planctomycetota bacterium]
MIEFVRSLYKSRRLIKELVGRDLKARYVGSSMGFFWSVIYPLLNLVVYTFVFRVILSTRFDDKAGVANVAIWMLAGILVWGAFAETLSRATNCLVENANLIQKVVFPAGVLPVYLAISSIINMAIGLPVVLIGVFYFGYIHTPAEVSEGPEEVAVVASNVQEAHELPGGVELPKDTRTAACNHCDFEHVLLCPNDGSAMRILRIADGPPEEVPEAKPLALGFTLIALPLLMLLQAVFTVGLGLFLSAFNLILRDTFHLVGVFIIVWMFSTPIFYPPTMITAAKHGGKYDFVLEYNPMYWLIECYRNVLLNNSWPDPALLGTFAGVAVVVFVLGATFFNSQRDSFPDLL